MQLGGATQGAGFESYQHSPKPRTLRCDSKNKAFENGTKLKRTLRFLAIIGVAFGVFSVTWPMGPELIKAFGLSSGT